MGRSEIQKRIIPRNWLFGRLAYICANLGQIIKNETCFLTGQEVEKLNQAKNLVMEVMLNKNKQSELIKREINEKQKGN